MVKFTDEERIWAAIQFTSGNMSVMQICQLLGAGKTTVANWIKQYQAHGIDALTRKAKNNSYSKEFKETLVKEYLSGRTSMNELMIKYNLRSTAQLKSWISKYNSHEEPKDYDPHTEVYMTMAKKTTLEERLEIVKYCLDHDKNYALCVKEYGCSYSQVYNWVRKYLKDGKDALVDKRGHRFKDEELSQAQLAQRKIDRLTAQLEESRRENMLLKKLQELERMCWMEYQDLDKKP